MGARAVTRIREIAGCGNKVQPWRMAGYDGWCTYGLQYGEREDSTIVRLSSDIADRDWFEFYQIADTVTRIDVQVTFAATVPPTSLIKRHHRQALRGWRGRRDGPTITMISDNRQGATLYLGKRSSDVYIRIYNKGAESGEDHYQNCVRYEIEFKNHTARSIAAQLSDGRLVRTSVVSGVNKMLTERLLRLPFAENETPLTQDNGPIPAKTVASARKWLVTQVRPTVEWLLMHCDRDDICRDLSL